MKLLRKLMCKVGLHTRSWEAALKMRCVHCDAKWVADAWQVRLDDYPKWIRVK